MTEQDTQPVEYPQCAYFHFGLIVTGETEQQHLPKLFRSLMEARICTFEVIRRVGQLGAITSAKRLKALRNGKNIPDKDAKIGLEARKYVITNACHFVLLIDDLEYDRRDEAQQIFDRYRLALDLILNDLKHRASVHFLVNMLEAYYFADVRAIKTVFGNSLADHEGDVEMIRHPKNDLKDLHPSFTEIDDGGRILNQINIEHILSRPDACASLRTLFAWCVKVLETYSDHDCADSYDKYRLHDGELSEITRTQLDSF